MTNQPSRSLVRTADGTRWLWDIQTGALAPDQVVAPTQTLEPTGAWYSAPFQTVEGTHPVQWIPAGQQPPAGWFREQTFGEIIIDSASIVGVYDPTGQWPSSTMNWPQYPAAPPSGFHWQDAGSTAIRADQPFTPHMILVRDGFTMPRMA